MPSITLHKICLIGPSEAVKQVRVKLTPPRAVEGKIPPVRDRVKVFTFGFTTSIIMFVRINVMGLKWSQGILITF